MNNQKGKKADKIGIIFSSKTGKTYLKFDKDVIIRKGEILSLYRISPYIDKNGKRVTPPESYKMNVVKYE